MVLIIAHRGASSLAPENTMPAIKKAWELGADAVEIDVAATCDGRLILLHDEQFLRTTDVRLRFPKKAFCSCSAFTLKEIRTLDAGSWFVASDPFGRIAAGEVSGDECAAYAGTPVPTLEEVLQFVCDRSWRVNIEIKKGVPKDETATVNTLVGLIDRMRIPAERLIVSSFSHEIIRQVRARRPDIEINALIGDCGGGRQDWGNYEFSIYNADATITDEEQIRRAHESGCLVNLYTVNSPAQMQRFVRAGVRGLFTDFPQTLVRLRDAAGKKDHQRKE